MKNFKTLTLATSTLALGLGSAAMAGENASKSAVLDTYADIAEAKYADSLIAAQRLQAAVDALDAPGFTERPAGKATVETYTVCFRRGVPERGIVVGRLNADGRRFVANTPDDETTLARLTAEEQMGRAGTVEATSRGNVFVPG